MIEWKGARVLVTGASSGLGTAFAMAAAKRGAIPILVARRANRLTQVAHRIRQDFGIQAPVIPCDLADPEARRAMMREAGVVDVLVANAGQGFHGPALNQKPDAHLRTLHLNVEATVDLVMGLAPLMTSRHQGGILLVASAAAFQPTPYLATYGASKAFLLSFGQALAEELSGSGVDLTVLCPGPVATEFFQANGIDAQRIPAFQGPMASPQDVAEAGIRGLEQGLRVVIPTAGHRWLDRLARSLPRTFVTRRAGQMLKAR